jgi:hypothetical protein
MHYKKLLISWSYLWPTNFSEDQKFILTFNLLVVLSTSWKKLPYIVETFDLLKIETFDLLIVFSAFWKMWVLYCNSFDLLKLDLMIISPQILIKLRRTKILLLLKMNQNATELTYLARCIFVETNLNNARATSEYTWYMFW